MGYLSQKKHETRKNVFLYGVLVLTALLSVVSLWMPGFKIFFFNLFHLYILSFIMIGYSLLIGRYKTALIFVVMFLVDYTQLSSSVNLFSSDKYSGSKNVELVFASETDFSKSFSESKKSSGVLILAKDYLAPYVKASFDGSLVTFIRVDFRGANGKQYRKIFKHLRQFVIKQDNPVIIFGEFGTPAWSRPFRRFLNKTGLGVKNKLIFTAGAKYNILTTPSYYVLGFQEMGVSDISIEETDKSKLIKTRISFNPINS